ncbi:MAG TPA: NUDIX domain-containing protein [Tepidiformaceae bacterium]|nr:NUDIX domain-containing protein [Thermoflexaceae bacterium]HMS60432.1 NUDIX domain-containing protein [Tepidiformaceae bacterium]
MSAAVVVVIFGVVRGQLSVLLIERAAEPCAGTWALPGGLLRDAESLDEAASRKLADETGVSDVFLEQLFTFDNQGGRANVVVTYFALVDVARTRLRPDLEWRPAWHPVRGVGPLAFGNERIVAYAEERLRNKLEYTNVVYSLLPARFTLTEMQRVYEAILGEVIDKRNFRRRVVGLGIVRETGETEKLGAHRPAMLYEFTRREPMVL